MILQIGPSELFAIDQPPASWRLIDQEPSCGECGRQLSLEFDSPPRTGLARCKCPESKDGRRFRRTS
jgi:hypothetical protein